MSGVRGVGRGVGRGNCVFPRGAKPVPIFNTLVVNRIQRAPQRGPWPGGIQYCKLAVAPERFKVLAER